MNFQGIELDKQHDGFGVSNPVAGLLHYRILVHPGDKVQELLEAERRYAVEQYGEDPGMVAEPVLELGGFYAREAMEETLLRWLHRIVGQKESFTALLNNYGSMPGYPLYIRVQDPTPFRNISRDLKILEGLLKSYGCPPVDCNGHPRLGVFSRIKAGLETVLLLDFSGRIFHAEMAVNELVLVKASAPYSRQEIVCRLRLSPKGLRCQL